MASPEDVSLVIEKVKKGIETGDQCHAMACGKSVPEWKDIFNEASAPLKMPVIEVGPLQGPSRQDTLNHVANIAKAFELTANRPAFILVDTTGNKHQKDPDINWRISQYVEQLVQEFPNAVYVQVVPDINMGAPLNLYCNNPKIPRDPTKPQYPL